jgi:predicted ArsR family transcriptional regulator
MELTKKQEEILDFLKKSGEQIEYEIAFCIKSSQRYTRFYLEELEKKKLVEKRLGTKKHTTFWKVKND